MLLLSRAKAAYLAGTTVNALKLAIRRGRLEEGHVFINGVVRHGITFASLRKYFAWPDAFVDQYILDPRGLEDGADVNAFWTTGEGHGEDEIHRAE